MGGVGFTTTPNGSSINFNGGRLGTYDVISVGLNAVPFGSQFGDIELETFVGRLFSGSDILQIDFGVNGLTAPSASKRFPQRIRVSRLRRAVTVPRPSEGGSAMIIR